MNFSVGKVAKTNANGVNIGVAPGRFDAKQIVLTALAIMINLAKSKQIRIIRTMDKIELSKCSFFITDGFANKFPTIPSYNNISRVWDKYGENIINYIIPCSNATLSSKYAKLNVCQIEKFDILLEYNVSSFSIENEDEKFANAVNVAINLITEIIKSAANQAKMHETIVSYINKCEGDILYIPFNMNARNVVFEELSDIKWIITKESDDVYLIESTNKEIDIRHVIKDRAEAIYAGRFFCKVTSYEVAVELIDKIQKHIEKVA